MIITVTLLALVLLVLVLLPERRLVHNNKD